MNSVAAPSASDSPESFVKLLFSGIELVAEAASMLKRMVDVDPAVLTKIREINPNVSAHVLRSLLRVAEGQLMPELLFNTAPAYKRMKSLPVGVQKHLLKQGSVDLVIDAHTGEHLKVPLAEVEPKQLSQIFDYTGVRDIDAQRAFLRRHQPAASEEVASGEDAFPFTFVGARVKLKKDVEYTLTEMKRIVGLMQARKSKPKKAA